MIKKLYPTLLPHITHLTNAIITTEIYPAILKVSRITPTLKPDKVSDFIDSYCPINNLTALDKIIEQYLKDQITDFINDHKIIHDNHHGSRRDHSTITALSLMQHKLINN